MYFAHSVEDQDRARWQGLADHLLNVSELAAARSSKFGAGRLGALSGMLHDLGKYTEGFQAYIAGNGESVDHSTAGAQEVLRMVSGQDRIAAQLAAYSIAGHHSGLPDRISETSSLSDRLKKALPPLAANWKNEISPDATTLSPLGFKLHIDQPSLRPFQLAMLGRMVFSCLVDADYVDTERFYAASRGETVDRDWQALTAIVSKLLVRFDDFMLNKQETSSETPINILRREILLHVREKAALPKGVFTLNVPTGGGKTLTSLAFALDHARIHGMDRIIYGIPFTSIIDQTAAIFRDVLGEHVVLEHHSSIEEERLEQQGERQVKDKLRLAMEDWAAPIVVTTNVQLFESLFANRSSRCRKLHNLTNAVIILDEAQTIPLPLLRPCVAALDELSRNYGCTIVLCTATQPALTAPRFRGGFATDAKSELAPHPDRLHKELKRVTLHIKADKTTDDELVAELAEVPQALVIVNSRRHARELYEKAKTTGLDGLVHLTTRQTAADRRRILETIRSDLQAGVACRVIATSLVEAGVDVDFPRVWRAMAGLDQIAQAAGRCNREGKRSIEASIVTVFEPAMAEPPREIKAFAEAMRRIAPKHQDLFSPEAIKDYFEEVYWQRGEVELDRIVVKRPGAPTKGISVFNCFSVSAGQTDFAYRTVGENFRLVDSGMEPVIIAIDDAAKAALAGLRGDRLKPGTAARKLQNFVVQVPPKDRRKLITNGHVAFADRAEQFAVLMTESFYTREVGLTWEDADSLGAEDLII